MRRFVFACLFLVHWALCSQQYLSLSRTFCKWVFPTWHASVPLDLHRSIHVRCLWWKHTDGIRSHKIQFAVISKLRNVFAVQRQGTASICVCYAAGKFNFECQCVVICEHSNPFTFAVVLCREIVEITKPCQSVLMYRRLTLHSPQPAATRHLPLSRLWGCHLSNCTPWTQICANSWILHIFKTPCWSKDLTLSVLLMEILWLPMSVPVLCFSTQAFNCWPIIQNYSVEMLMTMIC